VACKRIWTCGVFLDSLAALDETSNPINKLHKERNDEDSIRSPGAQRNLRFLPVVMPKINYVSSRATRELLRQETSEEVK
jgi:hypothetical protein